MKIFNKRSIKKRVPLLLLAFAILLITSCSSSLDYEPYGDLSSIVNTPQGAVALVNAVYTGLAGGGDYNGGWDAGTYSWRVQSMMTTDVGVCAWGGQWVNMRNLDYNPDFDWVTHNYSKYTPYISQITIDIDKIQKMKEDNPNQAEILSRYIAELRGLRGFYAEMLYFYYGPFTIITDPEIAADPDHPYVPRPSSDSVVAKIERDFKAAAENLPDRFSGSDYGRFSKAAALTGLMKLYMQEKEWSKAKKAGDELLTLGYSLATNYDDNFNENNKGGDNPEIILAVICTPTGGDSYSNYWLAESLPPDYQDPSGIPLTKWGGYKMPWETYDKFDQNDKRLIRLFQTYPTKIENGTVTETRDARAEGDIGAVPMKFAPDPSRASSQASGIDFPIFRFADVLLMQAEAINMANGGPNTDAYRYIDSVRHRAGLSSLPAGLSKEDFLKKIQDERLFELWSEGWRRIDLIRWGIYIQTMKDMGATDAQSYKKLFPLPRNVVNQSNGIVEQNPGSDYN